MSDAVLAELVRREPIVHRTELGTTRADFERLTAPDYWEVGASGRVYDREFACREIAPDTYLLTYLLLQGERRTRRLSVWQRSDGDWRILYHQGTVAPG